MHSQSTEAVQAQRTGELLDWLSCKNFDTQRIPSLQPLADESGADAIVGTHADAW